MVDISVIVTVYNLKHYIRSCLDSILQQKGVEFEVICVDDASTDGSDIILDEYEKKDSRIRILRNSRNKGHASTRNEGYRNAVGKYLYTIDGDDLLVKGALQRMYSCAAEYDLDLLGFSAQSFFDEESLKAFGEENEYVRKYEYPGVYKGIELFARLMKNRDRAIANRVMYCYKRSYFLKNNLFDEEGLRYADDSMFSYYLTAERAMCIPDQLYLRRYRQNSTVTSPLQKRYLESMIVLFVLEMNRWRSMEGDEEINRQIEAYFDLRLKEINRLQMMFAEQSDMFYLEKRPMDNYFYKRFVLREPLCLECLSATQIERIQKAKKVILYGAGYIATLVAEVLEYLSVNDYSVAVTKIEDSKEFFRGRRIYSIREFVNTDGTLVLVAMSKKNQVSVMGMLEAVSLKDIIWITL